jgi:hypothetical protein
MSDFVVGPMGERMDAKEYAAACVSALAFQAEQNAYIAAKDQAEADRQSALTQPILRLPIVGETVDEVKASADSAIYNLAQQMQERLNILNGI